LKRGRFPQLRGRFSSFSTDAGRESGTEKREQESKEERATFLFRICWKSGQRRDEEICIK
jgi:hypothetical protein